MNRINIPRICALLLITPAILPLPNDLIAATSKEWVTLENCRLIPNPDNDGDSFHIEANGKEYLLRLYLVDAPETKGGLMASRLVEQASYFGLTVPQVIQVGVDAKKFVEAKLSQPFTVQTRMASGLGRSNIQRFYGFVETEEGDLAELLVANGLARLHGMGAARPGSLKSADEVDKLQRLEQQAKQAKLGGWNQNVGTIAETPRRTQTVGLPSPFASPSTSPVRVATVAATAMPLISGKPSISAPSSDQAGKLDINAATKEELEKVPGIGQTLSDRIIAARPFQSADDLKKVKGIGNGKRYEQLRPYFR